MNGAGPARGLLHTALFLLLLTAARLLWAGLLEVRQPFEHLLFFDCNLCGLIMALCVVRFLLKGTWMQGERNRSARFMADYSYSLYLIHYSGIFMLLVFGLKSGSDLLDLLMYLVAFNVAAIVFWYVFERNNCRFGERLFGSHRVASARGMP